MEERDRNGNEEYTGRLVNESYKERENVCPTNMYVEGTAYEGTAYEGTAYEGTAYEGGANKK